MILPDVPRKGDGSCKSCMYHIATEGLCTLLNSHGLFYCEKYQNNAGSPLPANGAVAVAPPAARPLFIKKQSWKERFSNGKKG